MPLPLEVLAHDLAAALAENDLLRFELDKKDRQLSEMEIRLGEKDEMLGHLKWVVKRQRQRLVAEGELARGGKELADVG